MISNLVAHSCWERMEEFVNYYGFEPRNRITVPNSIRLIQVELLNHMCIIVYHTRVPYQKWSRLVGLHGDFHGISPQVQRSDTLEFHCCTVALRCTRRRAASAAVIPNASATAGLPWDALREGRTGPGCNGCTNKVDSATAKDTWTQDPAAVTLCGCSCIFRLLYQWADECRLDIWDDERGQQDLGNQVFEPNEALDLMELGSQKVHHIIYVIPNSLNCRQGTRITLSTCTDMGCLDLIHGSRTWCLQEHLRSEFPLKNCGVCHVYINQPGKR